ncbi:MAG: hypothetical protein GDA36_11185 [Rhodobacteraceae bacterium]|nr:hypothetical protein [Paracoccaceae bacterium]
MADAPIPTNKTHYTDDNPASGIAFRVKVDTLRVTNVCLHEKSKDLCVSA